MKRIGMLLLTLALLLCGIPVSAEETRTVVGRPLQEKLRESSPDDVVADAVSWVLRRIHAMTRCR